MKALLIRVGADCSSGRFNGPMNGMTREFVYIPIPESCDVHADLATPYALFDAALQCFGEVLPKHLVGRNTHLDPDFEHLTYGDQGQRAVQITSYLERGDLVVFYAGLRDLHPRAQLVYAIIGLYVIDDIIAARSVPKDRWHENAHTRRVLRPSSKNDVIIKGKKEVSGRLRSCLPIGSYRSSGDAPEKRPCYRVLPDLLRAWGGLDVSDGFIQRSARLPKFIDADKFYTWFNDQKVEFLEKNN
ncbi:MAG: hypothetical protein Q8R76_00310 [Candidatus Omnitrophota bacterium]|nr:hypothetical protein [Candidatus Omnitrophota bacterium]